MSNYSWTSSYNRVKNSVISITCNYHKRDPVLIYNKTVGRRQGSGFIVDILKGYIITSAKLVEDAFCIKAKCDLGQIQHMKLNLIGICLNRNVALCKISESSLSNIKKYSSNLTILNLRFRDNIKICCGHELMCIGYKNDNSQIFIERVMIKSIQNGLYSIDKDCSVGSPIVNSKGLVVGMYTCEGMVGSRSIIGIFKELCTKGGFCTRLLDFSYSNTNNDLFLSKYEIEIFSGVYINKDYETLKEGDILESIVYMDPFWNNETAYNITDLNKKSLLDKEPAEIRAFIGNDSNAYVCKHIEGNDYLMERKVSLKELNMMICVQPNVKALVCRNSKWVKINIEQKIVSVPDKFQYEIVCGMLLKVQLDSSIIVNYIYPESETYDMNSIKVNDIIYSINDIQPSNIEMLRNAIRSTGKYFTITTVCGNIFVKNKEDMVIEDNKIIQNNKLDYRYLV